MVRAFRASINFFAFLALFASANHCALEEIFCKINDSASDCCPKENNKHPHGVPCKEITAVESKSFSAFASVELKVSPVRFLAALTKHLLNHQIADDPRPGFRLGSENKILLSAHELILSPNAPPVA